MVMAMLPGNPVRRAAGSRVQFGPRRWLRGHSPRAVMSRWFATTAARAHGHQCGRSNTVHTAATCSSTEARTKADGRQRIGRESGIGTEAGIQKILPESVPGRPVMAAGDDIRVARLERCGQDAVTRREAVLATQP